MSTFRGVSIDLSDEYLNASDSIPVNRELNSNEIDESGLQYERHDDSTISLVFMISM
jgi:hypothetical protein